MFLYSCVLLQESRRCWLRWATASFPSRITWIFSPWNARCRRATRRRCSASWRWNRNASGWRRRRKYSRQKTLTVRMSTSVNAAVVLAMVSALSAWHQSESKNKVWKVSQMVRALVWSKLKWLQDWDEYWICLCRGAREIDGRVRATGRHGQWSRRGQGGRTSTRSVDNQNNTVQSQQKYSCFLFPVVKITWRFSVFCILRSCRFGFYQTDATHSGKALQRRVADAHRPGASPAHQTRLAAAGWTHQPPGPGRLCVAGTGAQNVSVENETTQKSSPNLFECKLFPMTFLVGLRKNNHACCRYKRCLVMVSHSQDFMNGVCTNVIHIHKRGLQYYGVSTNNTMFCVVLPNFEIVLFGMDLHLTCVQHIELWNELILIFPNPWWGW